MAQFSISMVLKRLSKARIDLEWYAGKRILVSGGAGFIGSWLVEALVRLKADVYVVDNLWRGSLDNLKNDEGSSFIDLQDHFFQADLQDFMAAKEVCERSNADIIFHLADIVAGVDFVFANEPFVFRVNNLINSNLFTAAGQSGVKRLVYLGTACSYPKNLQMQPALFLCPAGSVFVLTGDLYFRMIDPLREILIYSYILIVLGTRRDVVYGVDP